MRNIDITEWLLNNHIDSDTEIVMNGKQFFLADVLEKHLKEQFAISDFVHRRQLLLEEQSNWLMIKTEIKQWVNDRYYKEITIDNSTFKTMSFKSKENAESYGEYLINKLSERVDKDEPSDKDKANALPIQDISNSVKIAMLKQLEELSDHIPAEIYTRKVIEIQKQFL